MRTLRRSGISLAFLVLASASTATATRAQEAAPRRPHVLIFVTDDQGWADVGYHNPRVVSPRIDSLAAAGARFTQHYVMPQCTPTRVALLTGRYPSRFGPAACEASNEPALPLGTPTLAALARSHGYDTYLVGKWHLGSTPAHGPAHYGFAESYGSLAGAVGMYDHRYRAGRYAETWHRDGALIDGAENGRHATDLVADEAIRVLREPHAQPFLLYVAFHAVHTPLDERGRFVGRPTQLDPRKPQRWLDEDEIEWFHDPAGVIQSEPDPEKRLLLAAVHHLDHAVGRIVDALRERELVDDTLILFTSDNGPQVDWPGNAYPDDLKLTDANQPHPMRGKKLDLYEGGIHVPGFAVWPGHIAPGSIEVPVHVVDWLPTLTALFARHREPNARTSPAIETDGIDLGPLLFAPDRIAASKALPDRDLYWTWGRTTNRWALRHAQWKIVRYGKQAPERAAQWQLFDLSSDPREQRDVGAEHPEVRQRLHERFLRQRARDAE
ncbi:MAG: sulfatase-like hydrolase/transferase [Planctomycetes bacterium]|nr:sulfatase-like hydrolase/transferase [Planctomycetota bacterium]